MIPNFLRLLRGGYENIGLHMSQTLVQVRPLEPTLIIVSLPIFGFILYIRDEWKVESQLLKA